MYPSHSTLFMPEVSAIMSFTRFAKSDGDSPGCLVWVSRYQTSHTTAQDVISWN